MLQGTLDLLVLATLGTGPSHGYAIARTIERQSQQRLAVEEGSLYPALRRLERRGELASEWRTTPTGRRAKFYRLTSAGHERLREQADLWARLAGAVSGVLARCPALPHPSAKRD
jgi:transcriptional regulator